MEPGPDAGTGLWLGPGHPACWGTCLPGTSSSWWLEGMGFWPGLPISGGHLTFFLMPLYLFLETPLHFFGCHLFVGKHNLFVEKRRKPYFFAYFARRTFLIIQCRQKWAPWLHPALPGFAHLGGEQNKKVFGQNKKVRGSKCKSPRPDAHFESAWKTSWWRPVRIGSGTGVYVLAAGAWLFPGLAHVCVAARRVASRLRLCLALAAWRCIPGANDFVFFK